MKWYMAIFIMKWKLVLIWDVILKSYLILSIKEFTQERLGTIFNLRHVFSVTHEQVFLDKCPWQLLLIRVFEGQIFFFLTKFALRVKLFVWKLLCECLNKEPYQGRTCQVFPYTCADKCANFKENFFVWTGLNDKKEFGGPWIKALICS